MDFESAWGDGDKISASDHLEWTPCEGSIYWHARHPQFDGTPWEVSILGTRGTPNSVDFVSAGEKLDTLLSERADAKDRAAASVLRSDTLGLLNRLRKSLKAEQKADPSLPADLETQVFGYFDLLESNAAETFAEAKRKAKTADNTPQP